jgi:hypothetical protein
MNLVDLLQNQLEIKTPHGVPQNSPQDSTINLFSALDEIRTTNSLAPAKTAASYLLEEKKKLKTQLETIEAANFTIPKIGQPNLAPLMQQVAENQTTFDFTKHRNNNNSKKTKQVYQPPSKKSLKIKEKGVSYHDRFEQKMSKQKIKSKLKK